MSKLLTIKEDTKIPLIRNKSEISELGKEIRETRTNIIEKMCKKYPKVKEGTRAARITVIYTIEEAIKAGIELSEKRFLAREKALKVQRCEDAVKQGEIRENLFKRIAEQKSRIDELEAETKQLKEDNTYLGTAGKQTVMEIVAFLQSNVNKTEKCIAFVSGELNHAMYEKDKQIADLKKALASSLTKAEAEGITIISPIRHIEPDDDTSGCLTNIVLQMPYNEVPKELFTLSNDRKDIIIVFKKKGINLEAGRHG